MKISNVFKIALIGGLTIFTACQQEDIEQDIEQDKLVTDSATTEKIPEEIYTKLELLGFNTIDGVEKVEIGGRTGYQILDMIIPEENLAQPIETAEDSDGIGKLFRARGTTVRVPNNGQRTLDLLLTTPDMPNNALVGLRRAIANYNQLNLRFRYQLRMVGDGSGGVRASTTLISLEGNRPNPSGGLPGATNGQPGLSINIPESLSNQSVRFFEHTWTHELGHTLGLRHSDFINRASCRGLPGAQGALFGTRQDVSGPAGGGAVPIPGTNTSGTLTNSIMASCLRLNNIRAELSPDDIRSLRALF